MTPKEVARKEWNKNIGDKILTPSMNQEKAKEDMFESMVGMYIDIAIKET